MIEVVVSLVFAFYFIKREKPKVRFLLYGYVFFGVALLLQLPFKYIQIKFLPYFQGSSVPFLIFSFLSIIVVEVSKYFSLKRFLKTRSFKNGILFGIGWASFESINFIKLSFFSFIFSFIRLSFDVSSFLSPKYEFFGFVFLFSVNLAATVLIVFSVIKKNLFYLFYAMLFSFLVFVCFNSFSGWDLVGFCIFAFLYSLFIIFHYRKIK